MKKIIERAARLFSGRIDFSRPGHDLLHSTLERLTKLSPQRPHQVDAAMRLVQQDTILGQLTPIAVVVIAVRRASGASEYLRSDDFREICEQAAEIMANIHVQASKALSQMMPTLPGMTVSMGHEKNDALDIAGKSISTALAKVSFDRSLLPIDSAVVNLCDYMGEVLKINRFEARKIYDQI